jgi:acetate kinase
MFCYRARKYLGALMTTLGGCQAVLLGGGIAENAPSIRQRILAGLEAMGLELDPTLNANVRNDGRITSAASRIEAWVLPTDEETVMAEEAASWLGREQTSRIP